MVAVTLENINKSYGSVQAVRGVSLEVEEGELFGLIGPDGAGKTTIFRILTTVLLADSGVATVAGWDVRKDFRQIRRNVGYMPGRFSLYQDLTVLENLTFFATTFGTTIEENYEVVREIYAQIEPFKNRRAGKLSGGMKQKLALSCALIHKPKVLFLDEPTTGVDAVSRQEFWEMLGRLKAKGITILVSTPYMDEAERCDRVALIQNGKILTIETPAEITAGFERPLWAVKSDNLYRLIGDLRAFEMAHSVFPFGEFIHLTTTGNVDNSLIINYLKGKGHQNIQLERVGATIEDCFMELMNEHEKES